MLVFIVNFYTINQYTSSLMSLRGRIDNRIGFVSLFLYNMIPFTHLQGDSHLELVIHIMLGLNMSYLNNSCQKTLNLYFTHLIHIN